MKRIKILLLICLSVFFSCQVFAKSKDKAILEKIEPKAIAERIQEHRMGELVIKTKRGRKVKIKQISHEFLFGTTIPNHLSEAAKNPMTPEERSQYLTILNDNFNYAVHENALKWQATEKIKGEVDYSIADDILDLMDEYNIPMRGHWVYWAKDDFLMNWLKKLNNDELRMAVKNRAASLMHHYKGRMNEFTLNDEMIHGDFFRSRLGYGIISEMAWMVKAHNPEVKIYMNDYGIVDSGHNAELYEKQIKNLLANGVPLDGIGMQGHRSIDADIKNTPYMVQQNLSRFDKFNLPIKITEALFVYYTDDKRAEELKKILPIYFAQPNVEAIIMKGFWEKGHWIPGSAMWKSDFSPTLQSQAYRDLVYGDWWTETEVIADEKGKVVINAFYGEYAITVKGKTEVIKLEKAKGKTVVRF